MTHEIPFMLRKNTVCITECPHKKGISSAVPIRVGSKACETECSHFVSADREKNVVTCKHPKEES